MRTVIYHSPCIDGYTAAAVAWLKYGDEDTQYVPAKYGDTPPDVTGHDVLIVDFSYPRAVLIEMGKIAKSVLLLDHHKSARDDYGYQDGRTCIQLGEKYNPVTVEFDMSRSGAGMAWDALRDRPRPWLVDYVEDRDLWRFALPGSKAVNAWIGSRKQSGFKGWLSPIFDRTEAESMGLAILAHMDQYIESSAKHAMTKYIAGYLVPVVNAQPMMISELVGHLAELIAPETFAAGWFQDEKGIFRYSLRSRGEFDVSEIAKRFGGGGHKNAAGFSSKTMVHGMASEFP